MNIKLCVLVLLTLSWPVFANSTLGTKEILLDNNDVQVVRLTYPAGTESGMHTHEFANRVIYVVKGGILTLTPADVNKPSNTIEFAEGTTLYLPSTTHNVQNIGDSDVVLIETEIK